MGIILGVVGEKENIGKQIEYALKELFSSFTFDIDMIKEELVKDYGYAIEELGGKTNEEIISLLMNEINQYAERSIKEIKKETKKDIKRVLRKTYGYEKSTLKGKSLDELQRIVKLHDEIEDEEDEEFEQDCSRQFDARNRRQSSRTSERRLLEFIEDNKLSVSDETENTVTLLAESRLPKDDFIQLQKIVDEAGWDIIFDRGNRRFKIVRP